MFELLASRRTTQGRFILCIVTLLFCIGAYADDSLLDMFTGETPVPAVESSVISTLDDSHTDDRIQTRLEAIFTEIEALERVVVAVSSGVVSLSGEVDNRADQNKALRLAGQVEGVVDLENNLVISRDLYKRTMATGWQLVELLQNALVLLPLFLFALLVLVLFWIAGRWVSDLQGVYRRISPNPFIAELLGQLARLACVLVGVVLALTLLDAKALIGTILGAAGLIGLAIGFAIRDTVENYIASILMSIRNPFDVNDLVNIDGYEGNVARLTSRATILVSPDGNHIRIANAQVFKAVIINYSRVPERRFEFEVGVGVNEDLLAAQMLAQQTLSQLSGVMPDPKPSVVIQTLGDSTVVLKVYGWVDQQHCDFSKVRSEAIRAVKQAYDDAAIEMPEPSYNVRLLNSAEGDETSPGQSPSETPGAAAIERPDVSLDLSIEERVNELLVDSDEINLLQPDAPKEL